MSLRRLVLALALVASGCALGPNYKRPEIATPDAWRNLPAAEAESLANTPWWEVFDDPQLQELIRIALVENKDLKIAAERIEEARARYGFTKADLWPAFDLNGTGGRLRFNAGSLLHTPEGDSPTAGTSTTTSVFATGVSITWELDLFGRLRRATEAQKDLFLGTEEARRATVLALVADVAQTYFQLGEFDRKLEIAKRTVVSRRESAQYSKDRFEGGIVSELDYRLAEAELHRVESTLFDLERLVALKEDELSFLLGRNPQEITRGRAVEQQAVPASVPAGLPSDLLDRRPDIREAEQKLAAATANIGQAKALLFPRIALTGSYGFASDDLSTLFDSESVSWNLIGNLLQPIFAWGKNKRRLEVTESQQRQTLYTYEKQVLQAFREVNDALVSYRTIGQQRVSQGERVKAEQKVLELADLRYKGGVSAYLEVLDAQRSLFDAELDETGVIGDQLVALVQLYKALGGGWPAAPEPPPEEQAH